MKTHERSWIDTPKLVTGYVGQDGRYRYKSQPGNVPRCVSRWTREGHRATSGPTRLLEEIWRRPVIGCDELLKLHGSSFRLRGWAQTECSSTLSAPLCPLLQSTEC
eukprot:scaffold287_cov337-Pavlova_lutheri.AAC.182